MFCYLENQNGCLRSFTKLNTNILTLCIREKSNDIDCNHLTSENRIWLSEWWKDCSNTILSTNSSFVTKLGGFCVCGECAERLLALIKDKLLIKHSRWSDTNHNLTLYIYIPSGEQVWHNRSEVASPKS